MREFPDDAICLEHLWRTRFAPEGEHAKCRSARSCARSNGTKRRSSVSRGPAPDAGHHLHVLAGTIFEKSSTSLHLWFYAMYLMTSTRCGISAKQLERELGVTYKTAWRMANLIRNKLMTQGSEPLDSGNPVEIDETYVVGHRRGTRRGRPGPESHKVPYSASYSAQERSAR